MLTFDSFAMFPAPCRLDTLVLLPIAGRSAIHFKVMGLSRRSRAAIDTFSLSPFRRFANSFCSTGSEAVGRSPVGADKAVHAPR